MKRVLLKLSGEALAGDKKTGFDESTVAKVALQVKELRALRLALSLEAAISGVGARVRILTG